MVRCENCGSRITPDMRFCKNCGTPIPADAFTVENGAWDTGYYDGADYRLIVISRGRCTRPEAEDLLEDLLQYDTRWSREILDDLPAEAARNLTREQASYLAQALTEYGMEVTVCDRNGYVGLGAMERESVFDSDGNYIRRFAEILLMLTAANRVIRPMRWGQPIDRRYIFMPDCPPPHPPVHRRRDRFLLERLYGAPESRHGGTKPVPRRETMMRSEMEQSGRMPMSGSGAMRGGMPSMGRNAGAGGESSMRGGKSQRGGAPSMGRNAGAGSGSLMGGSRSQRGGEPSMGRSGGSPMGGSRSRSSGAPSMGRGGRSGNTRPQTGGRPQGSSGGGSRGPSRGHGSR